MMEVFSVFATLSLSDMLSGPLDAARSAVAGMQGAVGALSGKLGALTVAMVPVALGAAALVAALTSTAFATLKTEKALGELATLGVRDLAAVEEAARYASNNMAGITKDKFITAAYDIKSGISSLSDEGVAAFTALAAKTAQATKATVADMTSLGATAYGIHKRMYAQLSDEDFGAMLYAGVAASVQAFKTTGSAMNQAMSNLGAAATQAKRPMEEQLAVLGTLQNTMEASVAGTAYKNFFRDATKGFKALGIEATDASGNMKSMPDLLAALEQKLGPLTQAKLDNITKAFGAESGAMIQNLLGKSDELRASIAGVGTAMQGGTQFLNTMAASMNAGLGPTLEMLRQRTQNFVEEIGKHFAPVLTAVAFAVSQVFLRLQEWAKSPAVGYMLKLVAGIGAAVAAVTAFSAALWFFTAVGPLLSKALAPAKAALLGLGWPILLLIAVGAALYAAYKNNFGGMADMLDSWGRKISLVVRGVTAVFQSLQGGVGEVRGELAQDIHAAGLEGLVVNVSRAVYRIREFFAGIWAGLNFDGAVSALTPAILILHDAFAVVGDVVAKVFGTQVTGAASEARGLGQVLGGVLSWALEGVATSIANVARGLDTMFSLFRWVAAVINGDWVTAAAMGQRIWDNFCASLMAFADLFRIGDWLREAWADALNFLGSINLFESGARLLDTFKEGIFSRAAALKDAVGEALSGVRNLLPFSDAKEGPLSTLTLSGARMMTTLGAGVDTGSGGLLGSVEGALQNVQTAMDDYLAPPGMGTGADVPGTFAQGGPSGRGAAAQGGKSLSIHIENINLPDVTDAQDFVAALQNLVMEYEGAEA